MSTRITRAFLEWRYWIATTAILAALAITAAIGAWQLSALQNNARYSAALVELAEAANDAERELLNIALSADGEANTGAIDPSALDLNTAITALAEVYTALRLSDPDATDDDDEFADNLLINRLALDQAALEAKFGLFSRGMPFEMVAVWESEDDGLEQRIGEFLRQAIIVRDTHAAKSSAASGQAADAIMLFDAAIHGGLAQITHAIRDSAKRSAEQATWAIILGALICGAAAVANALLLFRPMAKAVMAYQEELVVERDRAIASAQGKKDFLAVMSHELRTPMNGVLGFTKLALQTDLTPEQRDYLEMIQGSGEGLLELLNAILDLSKIEAGSLELEPHIFDVGETVDSAVQLLSAQALEKRLDLTAYVDPTLPSELSGDSGLLRKLVLNLVGNAIKFTSEGGVAVEVRRLAQAQAQAPTQPAAEGEDQSVSIEVTVRDTGIGIPEDKLTTIFDRFSQADASTKRLYEGTGLGLAICKEIAALMGGGISVESKVGAGSAFRATLTLHQVEPAAPSLREIAPRDIAGTKILIVDDNALNRRIAELQLAAYGAEASAVASAAEGVGALAQANAAGAPFQVALIDQMMPHMDGGTLLKMIRADARYDGLKTILSSSAGVRTDKDARKLGFDAAAPKPVNQARLIAAIADVIAASGPASQAVSAQAVSAQAVSTQAVSAQDAAVQDASATETTANLTADSESGQDQAWRAAAQEAEQTPEPAQSGAKPRVLLVDDNAANLKLAELMLKAMGYCVDKASNGVEAIDAAAKFSYAAILMDVRMPVMDGVEATRRIRQLPAPISATPIIAVTADIADNGEQALLAAGMDAVIGKPVNDEKLSQVLSEIIQADVSEVA